MKISSGQFVVYTGLDLSRGIYIYVCVCSEEKKLERKEKQERVIFRNKEKDF